VSRTPPVPTWWKNTYFWIAAILFVVGVVGLIKGPDAIRDPGQKREDHLVVLIYFSGAVLMLVNGLLSHRQTVQHYREVVGETTGKESNHGSMFVRESDREDSGLDAGDQGGVRVQQLPESADEEHRLH